MYDELFDALADLDAEPDEVLDRLAGDEEMYAGFLMDFPANENMGKLKAAVAAGDAETALKEVHTLKGVALNLGLLPLVDMCMDVLMALRAGKIEEGFAAVPAVEKAFNEFVNTINRYKNK